MATETEFRSTSHGAETVIYRRDCVAGMGELLDPESVDVVVTSPPYNLGISYRSYDDTVPRTEYLDWIAAWGDAVHRVLGRNGSLFLNIAGKPSDPWGPFDVLSRLRTRFVLQNTIHWIKSIAIDADVVGAASSVTENVAIGHYKPINSRRYVNDCHEYIFHLTKFGDVELDRRAIGVEYQDKSNVGRWAAAGDDRRCRGNTWFVPYRTIKSRDRDRPHPATFPIRIPMMCTRLHGIHRVTRVIDPFLGLGHSALACKTLGVSFVGFETDEGYFAEARRLIESFDPEAVDARPTDRDQPALF
jgi:site-specific DNA-methyltransferase (adenine-specific)